MSIFIKQGDAYAIPVKVSIDDVPLEATDLDMIGAIEFMLSEQIRKVYPEDVVFDDTNKVFLVPVTQQETFGLEEGEPIKVDVRVEFPSGDVVGTKTMKTINVIDALSEEEL